MITIILILSLLILLTYAIYPAVVITWASLKKPKEEIDFPAWNGRVFLFMAAHNEEAVIRRKLDSILQSDFPSGQLFCYIGSDASTDQTNAIIGEYEGRLNLSLTGFSHRQGKPSTINQLVSKAREEHSMTEQDLFLLTDANVLLDKEFILRLSRAFSNPETGLADGVQFDLETYSSHDGLAGNERQYLKIETQIKQAESSLWGYAMGPFGGAYMIRQNLYKAVPDNFLVDDFFIFYHVIKQGYKSRVIAEARCGEAISGSLQEEFKRKVRISTGNFQNTVYYASEILRIWKLPNLLFIIHKVLRWQSPLFVLAILILLAVIAGVNSTAAISLLIMICLLVGVPLLNYLLNRLNLRIRYLQGATYLIIMNLALLGGFFKFLKGVKSNVWEPTKRSI